MESAEKQQTGADARRGIQNTVARFARDREAGTLQERLLGSANDERFEGGDEEEAYLRAQNRAQQITSVNGNLDDSDTRIFQILQEEGLVESENEVEGLLRRSSARPSFPYAIVLLAITKDVIDPLATLTLIGILVSVGLAFPIAMVLYFWIRSKATGGWWKKRAIRWLWLRYTFTIVTEFVPFFQIIPATTIFVLMVQYRETKIVTLLNVALERVRSSGIPLK